MGNSVINNSVKDKIDEMINLLEITMRRQNYDEKTINKKKIIYIRKYKKMYYKYLNLYNERDATIILLYELENIINALHDRIKS